LPQACGPSCRYTVHVFSFVFKCTPNPSSLPDGQADGSYWNGTMNEDWTTMNYGFTTTQFYIAWESNGPNGTSGNGSCSAVPAQFDIEVRTIALSTWCLTDSYFNFDSRSRRKEGSNLLR
jgi:hypothetical protein